ncbi:MAG: type II toxin-antitoxin system VapC family toxin [Terracidiphilus sp.]
MRLLLDTHVLLWLMEDSSRLSREGRALIADASEVYVSSASIWEIAIKSGMGKIKEEAKVIADKLEATGLKELHVTNKHAIAAGKLPRLHRDPFDRLLVAQAISELMRFLTADKQLTAYSELVVAV